MSDKPQPQVDPSKTAKPVAKDKPSGETPTHAAPTGAATSGAGARAR